MPILKKFFDKVGDAATAVTGNIESKSEANLIKARTMETLANQPAQTTNKWLIIIPAVILVAGGITAFILLRKKKG